MRGMMAKSIAVSVSDGTVTLDGTVDSWIARDTRNVLRGPRQAYCARSVVGSLIARAGLLRSMTDEQVKAVHTGKHAA